MRPPALAAFVPTSFFRAVFSERRRPKKGKGGVTSRGRRHKIAEEIGKIFTKLPLSLVVFHGRAFGQGCAHVISLFDCRFVMFDVDAFDADRLKGCCQIDTK